MLTITIRETELFDNETSEFIPVPATCLQLEHSLLSVSKWEAKWQKPFISREPKTREETIDYIRCMTVNRNVDSNCYFGITNADMAKINEYIEAPMTATWFKNQNNRRPNREIVTSEIIYYWMVTFNIPFKCERWHLNRLLTLIRVCSEKNNPKKMSKQEALNQQRALNASRRSARKH